MTPPASVHSIRNQSEAHKHERPATPMTQEEVEAVIEALEEDQKVLVWYRPMSQFKCKDGEFTYEGAFPLDQDELDHVANDRPLCATVTSAGWETYIDYDAADEDTGECEETEYVEVVAENLDTEVGMTLTSLDCTGIWSIEVRDDLEGAVEKVCFEDGTAFRFNLNTKEATLDGEDVSRDELVTLHQSLNRFLSQG